MARPLAGHHRSGACATAGAGHPPKCSRPAAVPSGSLPRTARGPTGPDGVKTFSSEARVDRPRSQPLLCAAMQLGILGLPKVGKTTLFNTLTASRQETDKYATSDKTNVGMATVRDTRLEQLRDLFKPRRYVPATIQYMDIPGIKRGESAESLDLAKLKTVDALVHVVRAFEDPELLHSEGSVDSARDVANVDLELILADHDIVERRI